MDKIQVMKNYFLSEQGATLFFHKLDVVTKMRKELLTLGLCTEKLNINTLYRIVSRCISEVSEGLCYAHLDLGIALRRNEDIYFWAKDPFETISGDWPVEIEKRNRRKLKDI